MRKVLWTAGAVFAIGLAGFTINGLKDGFGAQSVFGKQYPIDEQKSLDSKAIVRVKVSTENTDVKIIPAKDDKISVHFHGEGNKKGVDSVKFRAEERGSELVVAVEADDFVFMKNLQTEVEIALPQKQYERLRIHSSSGDVDVEAMGMQYLDIQTSSGDMNLEATKAERTSLRASSGDIDGTEMEGEVQVDTSSGDVTLQFADILQPVTIETSSGDVKVNLQQEPSSLVLQFDSSSGDGRTNANLQNRKESERSLSGSAGTGKHALNVETSSGDFHLNVK